MSVVISRGDYDRIATDAAAVRLPRRGKYESQGFGVTLAKSHPPYVFAIRGASALVHRVDHVEMHWYGIVSHQHLARLKRPYLFAKCVCGASFSLRGDRARTCLVPSPDALLCGRCHGEPATFGKHGAATKAGVTRTVAHVKLGCVVQGY